MPFLAPGERPTYEIEVAGAPVEVSVLSMGNPHAVQVVGDVDSAPVATQGPLIERHPAFPNRVNAGYLQVVSRDHVRLRVWERGAGETLACGTGACAAVVAGIRRGPARPASAREHPGRRPRDRLGGHGGHDAPLPPVMMTGDAVRVFEGEIDLPAPGPQENPAC